MSKVLSLLVLLISHDVFSQVTIFYDDGCAITIRELATHYRVAKVDTATKKFEGVVDDYWNNDTVMVSLRYNQTGKSGPIRVQHFNGIIKLAGQYVKDNRSGVWKMNGLKDSIDFNDRKVKPNQMIDSLETCLKVKESFRVSPYIRKADYPEIYSLVSKSYSLYNNKAEWNIVEEHPYFPNGMEALGVFIEAFIKYPDEALKNNIKGQVIIEFTISEDGSTTDHKVIKGLGFGCDEEALRVLKLLPDWVPGYQNGKAVRTKFRLPITFG